MKLHYSIPAKLVLDPQRRSTMLDMLRNAGVAKLWLHGYFFGHFDAPLGELVEARAVLERHGFEVGIMSMPVGHPGNSLDPDDPAIDLRIPAHWRYRIDRYGRTVYHCADIEDRMVRDNVDAMVQIKDAGFTDVFLDDDFRMGNHGPEVMGCFCDDCIAKFNATYHRTETRESIGLAIARREHGKMIEEWTDHICGKITSMAKTLALPGINLGIMVMHRGDDRHGIRIADLKPYARHMRVGEAHFGNRDFGPARGKASEIAGMQLHIALMYPAKLYSETTCFPPRALSVANWICKAKLAVALGIPNIFLMGGTWLLDPAYWKALANALPGLRAVEGLAGDLSHARVAPVHVAVGQGDFELPWWALRAGIPARPVLASDPGNDGEILLVLGTTQLGPDWSNRLPRYKRVLFDATAAAANKSWLQGNPACRVLERRPPAIAKLLAKVLPNRTEQAFMALLRQELHSLDDSIPCIDKGRDIFLAWIKDKEVAIACNLLEEPNAGRLKIGQQSVDIKFGSLEMVAINLGGGKASIDVRV
ncbi:MAG: hypothetical protein Q6365_022265 [Candidatus Sigynarchaeota archaeon]